jgi:hypothetical protein
MQVGEREPFSAAAAENSEAEFNRNFRHLAEGASDNRIDASNPACGIISKLIVASRTPPA